MLVTVRESPEHSRGTSPSVCSWPDLWQWSIRLVNTMSRAAKGASDTDLVRQAELLEQDGYLDPVGRTRSVYEKGQKNECWMPAWVRGTGSQRWMSDSLAMLRCCSIFWSLAVIPRYCQTCSKARAPLSQMLDVNLTHTLINQAPFARCRRCNKCDVM